MGFAVVLLVIVEITFNFLVSLLLLVSGVVFSLISPSEVVLFVIFLVLCTVSPSVLRPFLSVDDMSASGLS